MNNPCFLKIIQMPKFYCINIEIQVPRWNLSASFVKYVTQKNACSVQNGRGFDRYTSYKHKNVMTTCITNSSSATTAKLARHDKRYRLSPAFNSRRPTCSIRRELDPLLFLLHRVTIVRRTSSHHRDVQRSISLRNTPAVLRMRTLYC